MAFDGERFARLLEEEKSLLHQQHARLIDKQGLDDQIKRVDQRIESNRAERKKMQKDYLDG